MISRIQDIRSIDFAEGAVLNVNKPTHMTSFGAVQRIRRWTQCRKVGHAGTLDPLAEGVILVCTGKATKRVSELMTLEKTYEGIVELGKTTETDDAEGDVIQQREVPELSKDDLENVLKKFVGDIMQIPPMYSALKQGGRRLYKMAREGTVVERPPRPVHVDAIELLNWDHPELTLRVRCGKGTYIRALARDIGDQLNTGGYLKALTRVRIGDYKIEDALSLSTLREALVGHEDI